MEGNHYAVTLNTTALHLIHFHKKPLSGGSTSMLAGKDEQICYLKKWGNVDYINVKWNDESNSYIPSSLVNI